MSDTNYDNKNSGALFEPDPENQSFLKQGLIDVNGKKIRVAIISYPDKDGNPVYDVYVKQGRVWDNREGKENEKAPDFSGKCYLTGSQKRLAMWDNVSQDSGREYTSVKVQNIEYTG